MHVKVDGSVERFITSMEAQTQAKILRTVDLLEKFGNRLGMPHSRKVTAGIFELRIRGQQEVRIFYCYYKSSIYLLHGFIKKSQQTPSREIHVAKDKYKYLTS